MWLRRAYYGWLIPAAFVLPLWLLAGWLIFDAGGWAFVWVLFVAMPSVFVGQLGLTLLVRARASARARRAVSWWDVGGFTLWHVLTISLGVFDPSWWLPAMVITVLAGLALVWLEIWQLWRQATTSRYILSAVTGRESLGPRSHDARLADLTRQRRDVIVLGEGGGSRTGLAHPGDR